MKKVIGILFAAVMCVGVLAGCAASATGEPVRDHVILATIGEPVLFYPLSDRGSTADDFLVLSNVYDTLTFLNADGSLSPGLAESWEILDDGNRIRLAIRQGVQFHDGSVMTVEDVVFSLERGAAGPLGAALLPNFGRAEVVDGSTVDIHMESPHAAIMTGLSSRVAPIVSKAYFDRVGMQTYMEAPIGTGPYKFISAVSGDVITLEAFENHWRGEPSIKTVFIRVMPDAATQIIALENGDVHALRNPSITTCLRLDEARGVAWTGIDSVSRITLFLSEWGGSPLEDRNVRRAIQHAINKEDINIGVNEGMARVLDIDLAPMYGGHPTDYLVVPHDLDIARQYMAASNYNNEEIVIVTRANTPEETATRIIQAQLMDIGLNVMVNAVDGVTYNELWIGGLYDGVILAATSSLVDSDHFSATFMVPEAGFAFSQHSQYQRTREIYDIMMHSRTIMGPERAEIIRQAVDIATEEAYLVPLYNMIQTIAYNTGLSGVEAHCLGIFNFRFWSW